MNIEKLVPVPTRYETFRRSRLRFVPAVSGCYVLTTFSRTVVYIGLAKNLQRRMNQHLDSPEKTCETAFGRAVLFFWFETPDLNKVERTWMNIHIEHEGAIPLLNMVYSPTPV